MQRQCAIGQRQHIQPAFASADDHAAAQFQLRGQIFAAEITKLEFTASSSRFHRPEARDQFQIGCWRCLQLDQVGRKVCYGWALRICLLLMKGLIAHSENGLEADKVGATAKLCLESQRRFLPRPQAHAPGLVIAIIGAAAAGIGRNDIFKRLVGVELLSPQVLKLSDGVPCFRLVASAGSILADGRPNGSGSAYATMRTIRQESACRLL